VTNSPVKKKILIANSKPDFIRLLQMQLSHPGHGILLATNGSQAIDLAIAQRPDLIILHLTLPDMDGLEVARCIRQIPGTHAIPILAVAETFLPQEKERSFQCGCNDYISKPFTSLMPLTRVRNLSGSYRLYSSRHPDNSQLLQSD